MGTMAKFKTGDGTTHLIASTAYGTCGTEAATVAKVATIQDSQAFSLFTGETVHIKFTYSNTATNPTLNVNSTGAKSIVQYGSTKVGVNAATSWIAGAIVSLTYDGTSWVLNTSIGSEVKLNGTTTATADFYAPTTSGTAGQYLKSNGANNAPTWDNLPRVEVVRLV